MRITLSKETLDSLPSPDSGGLIRVTAALRVGEGGEVDLVEVDDAPVGEDEPEETETDDDAPMPPGTEPDLEAAQGEIDKAGY